MSFAPVEQKPESNIVYPKLREGEEGRYTLPARVSLIVDLGTQERQAYREEYVETSEKHKKALERQNNPAWLEDDNGKQYINTPQMPVRQCAVFADLVTELVDYGEKIGKKPFRIMLNKKFKGDITGFPLTILQARDNKGKIIPESPMTFGSRSPLTKLGKATGVDFVKNGNRIEELAGKAFAATVENKVVGEKCHTNFKEMSGLMEGVDVPEMAEPPILVEFETATAEQMKFLRKDIKEMIKESSDFEGSQIQKALAEFEESKQQTPTTTTPPTGEDFDDDVPF